MSTDHVDHARGPSMIRARPAAPVAAQWTGVNAVGFGLAGAVFGDVQRERSQPYFEVVTSAADAVRIEAISTTESLALFGALVGLLQLLVLRAAPFSQWWIPATMLGWSLIGTGLGVISGLTFGSVSTIGPDRTWPVMLVGVLSGALVCLLPGVFQWIAMRQVVDARTWPLISLAGLGLGMAAAAVVVRWGLVDVVHWLRPEDFPSAKALVCAGIVIGTVYGIVTGPTLARLTGSP